MRVIGIIMLFFFTSCGANITVDKIEGEATIDHKIRLDFTTFEKYFRTKCKKDLENETGIIPNMTEIDECVNYTMAEMFSRLSDLIDSEDL